MIPIPSDDDARIKNLHTFEVLDTPDEDSFDAITRLAARLFAVPIALVSLVDKDRQWFKSSHGLDADQTPRDQAFCTCTIMENEPLVVLDATLDDRFKDNPLVTGELGIRFYAGAPFISSDNYRLGTFCIIDMKTRTSFNGFERNNLIDFATTTVDILEMRRRMLQETADPSPLN